MSTLNRPMDSKPGSLDDLMADARGRNPKNYI